MKKALSFAAVILFFLGLCPFQAQAASNDDPSSGLNLGTPTELTGFAGKFSGHLVTMQDGRPQSFDASTLQGVKYFAFYYSASWCPPCRQFTPKLVEFYNGFKSEHPNFELIFVNHDYNEAAMLQYMKTDAMPWPAVRFEDIPRASVAANRYCGSGIPDLVLVDADGKVLADSFNGQQYTGPYQVLDAIRNLVPKP